MNDMKEPKFPQPPSPSQRKEIEKRIRKVEERPISSDPDKVLDEMIKRFEDIKLLKRELHPEYPPYTISQSREEILEAMYRDLKDPEFPQPFSFQLYPSLINRKIEEYKQTVDELFSKGVVSQKPRPLPPPEKRSEGGMRPLNLHHLRIPDDPEPILPYVGYKNFPKEVLDNLSCEELLRLGACWRHAREQGKRIWLTFVFPDIAAFYSTNWEGGMVRMQCATF